jgi:hypothetical protein
MKSKMKVNLTDKELLQQLKLGYRVQLPGKLSLPKLEATETVCS